MGFLRELIAAGEWLVPMRILGRHSMTTHLRLPRGISRVPVRRHDAILELYCVNTLISGVYLAMPNQITLYAGKVRSVITVSFRVKLIYLWYTYIG